MDTVRISKNKAHADDEMVRTGRVRAVDKFGNDLADRAAEFERRRVPELVIDLRRRCTAACVSWYPLALELHRFFIAIARAVVNEDGRSGIALHPTVWSDGVLPKRRILFQSAWKYAWVSGPPGLLFIPQCGLMGYSLRDGCYFNLPGSMLVFLGLLDFGVMARLVGLM